MERLIKDKNKVLNMKRGIFLVIVLVLIPYVIADSVVRTFHFNNSVDFPNMTYNGTTVFVNYTRVPPGVVSSTNMWAVEQNLSAGWNTSEQNVVNKKLNFYTNENWQYFNFIAPKTAGNYIFNGSYWMFVHDPAIFVFPNQHVRVVACDPRAESCDGLDNDCDYLIDEGVLLTFYGDSDSDTYGNLTNTIQACTAPVGYVANSGDCNDKNASVHPGATEVCNGYDDDCDLVPDDGALLTFYRDADSDTYGNLTNTAQACVAPVGYITNNTDCNDKNASINPGATEVCDGIDNNCKNGIDEGVLLTFYRDADSDTYGNLTNITQACTAPVGYITNNADCNDLNPLEKPGQRWFLDFDSDGYSNGTNITSCPRPFIFYKVSSELSGGIVGAGECNDSNASIHIGVTELCNGVDDNCDRVIDEPKNSEADIYCDGCVDFNPDFTAYAGRYARAEIDIARFTPVASKWIRQEGCSTE